MADDNLLDQIEIVISEEDHITYRRLDQLLSDKIEDLSRSAIKRLFEAEKIFFDEEDSKKLELKKLPPAGSKIIVEIPPPLPIEAKPENIPLDILFEDEHLVIVNKPAGLVTHPAPGNYTGTLVNAILHHCPDLSGIGDKKRPGIVHRLDKGTSGVMVVAKSGKCHEGLVLLFSTHDIIRVYEAVLMSTQIPPSGKIESLINRHPTNRLKMTSKISKGKTAITHYKVLNFYKNFSHVAFKLETGRTHQIRVHASEQLKAPILMDPLYGNPKDHIKRISNELAPILKDYEHPLLHAKTLGFIHPITKKELLFEVKPPEIFLKTLEIAKQTS